MKQIYHRYDLWEDHKHGFYNNCSGETKKEYSKKIIEMFSNPELTEKYMMRVINEWKYSLEHNLTNPSINKIAYIGQCACCLYCGAPSTVTMETWRKVDVNNRNKADEIAEKCIKKWKSQNKNIQLCLSIN